MGLILAGILAGVLVICFSFWYSSRNNTDEFGAQLLCFLAIMCVIAGVTLGIGAPISGYGEPKMVSTTELVSLRDDSASEGTRRLFYVSVSGTNSYTYYEKVDSSYASSSQKAYESNTISNSNVTIVEDESNTDAKLVTYVRYGKKSFWTFAALAERYEYVFYVPTGTIVRDVSLG